MRRHEEEEEVTQRCDLCAIREPDEWWQASFPDITIPGMVPDPDFPGLWLPLIYPASCPWGICGECRACVDAIHDSAPTGRHIEAFAIRCDRYMPKGSPFVPLLRILVELGRSEHSPWEREEPPPSGIRRSWIEDNQ